MEAIGSLNRRARDRVECTVTLTCRVPATPVRAQLADVSHRGCRLQIASAHTLAGATVSLELPNGDRPTGQVVWCKGREAGVRFHRPLSTRSAASLGLELTAPSTAQKSEQAGNKRGHGVQHWFRNLASRFF